MSDAHRMFVAVPVPAWVREDLEEAVDPLRSAHPELRWVAPESWHLTLLFLGDVSPALVPRVAGALAGSVAQVTTPRIRLDGTAGRFGRRVLWAGIAADEDLDALAGSVRAALAPLGFEDDKEFSAHLTLARAPKDGTVPAAAVEAYHGPTSSWRVEQLNLMRSVRKPGGAVHETVATWPLP